MDLFSPEDFFAPEDRLIRLFLDESASVLEAVTALPGYSERVLRPAILGELEKGAWVDEKMVRLEPGSRVERGAIVRGPTILGPDTVVRSGAYIRGHVLTGRGCLIGHASELRQVLLMNQSAVPHLNCIFTSLVGCRVNIAGNTHTANMLINRKEVEVRAVIGGETLSFPTGQTWFGSVVGDDSSLGAFVLLQPGTVIGQRCLIHPQCSVSGYVPHNSIVRPVQAAFEVIPREAQ
jgi:NDP-sugar pyrophosphorylase family protein